MLSRILFPGIILHEVSHYLLCKFLMVKIHEVKFLTLSGSTLGYVKHDIPRSYVKRFLISISPFIINNLLSILILLVYMDFTNNNNNLYFVTVFYLAFSFSAHSLSSTQDIKYLLPQYKLDYFNPLALIGIILFPFLYIITSTRKYYFNYIFALLFILVIMWILSF